MTETRAAIAACETRLVNAWPSFEVELAGSWLVRFAEGYSKRANSATPIVPGATLDRPLLDDILRSFAVRGIAPCFRLTGLEDESVEEVLEAAGLVDFDPSLGMVAPVGRHDLDPELRISPAPDAAWIAAAAHAYGGDKANGDLLGRIVGRIRQPAAFATLTLDGREAAWGMAVAERGHVGLFDIVVAPEWRGHGLGRRLVTGLLAWGRDAGAETAYLQMRETNAVADSLYRSLGFETLYRYRHRIEAGRLPKPAMPEAS